jgi:hypothetical protein
MTKLATKLACATVCLLLLCAGNRSEAGSLTDQEETLSDQQVAKVKELIHDAIQPNIDVINRKIDALVGVIQANHLEPGRGGQVQRIADYKTANDDGHKNGYNNNNNHEDSNNNDDEHERKYVVKKYYYHIYCCHPRWYHCCRPHYCRPRCDDCYRPRCYKPRYHYCRPRDDDP